MKRLVFVVLLAILSLNIVNSQTKKSKVVSKKTTTHTKKSVSDKRPVIVIDTLKDARDGNSYKMIKFGNQFWMVENLKWKSEGSFVYDDLAKNERKLGRLYTLDVSKIACPVGSHLPSRQEWDSLVKIVDPTDEGDAGDKLVKKTGFAATMSGYKNAKGKYTSFESEGLYWGSNTSVIFSGDMSGGTITVNPSFENKEYKNAYSVRCVKD